LAFQLKSVSGSLQAGAISLGQWLLPKISDVAKWATGVINFFKGKSIFSTIASDAAIGLFVSAVVLKLGKGISSIFSAGSSLVKGIVNLVTGKGLGGAGGGLAKTAVMEVTADVVNVNGKGAGLPGGTGGKVTTAEEAGAGALGIGGTSLLSLAGISAALVGGAYIASNYIPKKKPSKQESNLQAYNEYEQLVQSKEHLKKIASNTSKGKQKINIHIKATR